jgi:ABC-2 type transport system ATP-binding protein
MTAVDVRGLTKTFKPGVPARLIGRKGVVALRGIDLRADAGEVFGLLGPNGAGKSTLVKTLLGLVRKSGGHASILGKPIGSRAVRQEVGYLPEQAKYPPYLTGRQVVEFFAGLGGVARRERKARAAMLLDRVELSDAADRRVGGYSKGMRQRVGLAQALVGGGLDGPRLILLDEPTDGVDPLARRLIRDVLAERREAGACVFLNSHLLGELELICDRAAILVDGKVVQAGTLEELAGGQGRFELEITPDAELSAAMATDPNALPTRFAEAFGPAMGMPWSPAPDGLPRSRFKATGARSPFEIKLLANGVLTLRTTDSARVQPVLDLVRRSGLIVKRWGVVRPTLEDLFVDAVKNQAGPPRSAFPVIPHANPNNPMPEDQVQ